MDILNRFINFYRFIIEYQSLNNIRGKISQQQATNDSKVSMYLEEINKYNETSGILENGVNNVISENASYGSNHDNDQALGSGGSGSGGTGSNMAYLDSTAGHRNISGSNVAGSGSGNWISGSNGGNI